MGLFDKTEEKAMNPLKELDRIIDHLNYTYRRNSNEFKDRSFITYLENIKKNPETAKIQPLLLFTNVLGAITSNTVDYYAKNYMEGIQQAEEIYFRMFPYGEDTPDFLVLSQVFVGFFHPGGIGNSNLFNYNLMSTFRNKYNYADFMSTISRHQKASECLHDIIQYALSIRAFFIDDETYSANLKYVAQQLLRSGDRAAILQEELKKAEHMAGIYDIDEADVAKTEQQLLKANALLQNTVEILEQADRKSQQLNRIMKDTSDAIQEISKRETNLLTMKAATAKEDLNAAYNSFLEEQKQEIVLQKDVLISQLYQEAESRLNELRAMAKTITISANTELARINLETSNAMDKIHDMVNNDADLQRILAKAEENGELYEKINKLELLSTQNIDTIAKTLETKLVTTSDSAKVVVQQGAPTVAMTPQEPVVYVESQQTEAEATPTVDAPVNMFLDTSIPFEKRYALVMAEKQKRIEQGEHFHAMFDDVLTILMEDANPYMIGPSGCGKTFMVKQIASLLHMDFTDIGYINEEYDILGFQTATGAYSATNFYRCYKFGKIAFCDELDNGNSRATVKLNSFLSNGRDARYSFPNGESVKRHKNFRIIAAGNTAGNGADANYNTREKIEESVQQRFTPIYVGYDNAVEEKILGNYKDWYEFAVLFRKATDAWGNLNDCSAPGILTTRDTARIRRYLDNKSLDMGKILDYEFIQTKDMEYLAFLTKYMGEKINSFPRAKYIYDTFNQKVKQLREKGGMRN